MTPESFQKDCISKIQLNKCGVENFTHHDLRRTASTIWASPKIGSPPQIDDGLLNQMSGTKFSQVARIYNRHEHFEEKYEALARYENFLLSLFAS
jgi:hypothetical protein